jgi:glucokinase
MKKSESEFVVADVGGTHARFAIARVSAGMRPSLGEVITMRTAEHVSLRTAWEAFVRESSCPVPMNAAISVAGSLGADMLRMTNSPWVIQQSTLAAELGLDHLTLLNDFGAMAYAVSLLEDNELDHICGPARPLPDRGVISVLGPGTGLGAAMVIRRDGPTVVVETEGGHGDFAPLDQVETAIADRLRERFLRVSVERIVSGPGLANLHEAIAALEGQAFSPRDDADLWAAAIAGEDSLAAAALDRFCLAFGAVAGDLALAQGATAVVLAGGLSQRIKDRLMGAQFVNRFCAKGRFQGTMEDIPVKLIRHPHPGLLGAAASYVEHHLAPASPS